MKTIGILFASLLAASLFAFSPNSSVGTVPIQDSVITLGRSNNELIRHNNECIKVRYQLPMGAQVFGLDSTDHRIIVSAITSEFSE